MFIISPFLGTLGDNRPNPNRKLVSKFRYFPILEAVNNTIYSVFIVIFYKIITLALKYVKIFM